MASGGDPSRAWLPLMQRRHAKESLHFPLRDLAQPEYNSGVRSHRTAWADSRSPQPEVRGHEYHRSDRQLSVRWESHCPIETNCCANQGHSSWACRSRQPSSRCGSVRVTARTPLRTKMPWRPTLLNALELRLHFQPRCRHRLWQLLVWYLALGTTGNSEQRLEKRMSSARLFLIQPRRNRYVLRLYKCIGTQRLASVARNLVVHGARRVTGIDFHINLAQLAHKSPSSLDRAGGARRGRRE